MQVCEAAASTREALAALARPLGFVPTMGALHAGHLHLVAVARSACASLAASVFVNPMQFGPGEDFERYPRDLAGDRAALELAGVDLLFSPSAPTLYPSGFSTTVDVGELGTTYEGALRPTHFRGVTTVVTKLLHVVQPDFVYFGQKDAQQSAVVRKLVRDLDFPVAVEIVPTVREADGVAMSSRNAYLSPQERAAAPTLYESLQIMLEHLRAGAETAVAREHAQSHLRAPGRWDYLDVVDAQSFAPLEHLRPPAFVIGAVRFGTTRLLDNLWIAS